MLFRFGVITLTAAMIALAAVTWERRCVALRRALARQHFRLEIARERVAKQRLEVERLASPARIAAWIEKSGRPSSPDDRSADQLRDAGAGRPAAVR